jgi:hypothetical protein
VLLAVANADKVLGGFQQEGESRDCGCVVSAKDLGSSLVVMGGNTNCMVGQGSLVVAM